MRQPTNEIDWTGKTISEEQPSNADILQELRQIKGEDGQTTLQISVAKIVTWQRSLTAGLVAVGVIATGIVGLIMFCTLNKRPASIRLEDAPSPISQIWLANAPEQIENEDKYNETTLDRQEIDQINRENRNRDGGCLRGNGDDSASAVDKPDRHRVGDC